MSTLTNAKRIGKTWGVLAIGLGVLSLAQTNVFSNRQPNTMEFPKVGEQSDLSNILDDYPAYLKYVLEVGGQTNRKQASRLDYLFRELKRKDEAQAARFLRGLRFEMHQRLEMSGLASDKASTNNTAMRQWVTRFLPIWTREADEYLFRAKTNALVKR